MEVVTADDYSPCHLGGDNTPGEDATADGNLTCERTFLVCTHPHRHRLWAVPIKPKSARTDISSVYRLGGCFESEAHILIPTLFLRRHLLSACPSQMFCGQTCPEAHLGKFDTPRAFAFWKRGCFWNAFSTYKKLRVGWKCFGRDKVPQTCSAMAIESRACSGECRVDYQLTTSK
jgi:hypothetical protein